MPVVDTYTDASSDGRRRPQVDPDDTLPDKPDGQTTTLLNNSTVLVVGGENKSGVRADTYAYDLATDTWSPADSMTKPRTGHVTVRIPDGPGLGIEVNRDALIRFKAR